MTDFDFKEDISYETAKLLKSKGFDGFVRAYYDDNRCGTIRPIFGLPILATELEAKKYPLASCLYVNHWLSLTHNLYVSPYFCSLGWYFEVYDTSDCDTTGCKPLYQIGIPDSESVFNSVDEAFDKGIAYALRNFVK